MGVKISTKRKAVRKTSISYKRICIVLTTKRNDRTLTRKIAKEKSLATRGKSSCVFFAKIKLTIKKTKEIKGIINIHKVSAILSSPQGI